jgi:hypothetical protein
MAAVATRQLCEGESTLCLVAFLMIAQSLLGVIALTVLTWISPEVPKSSSNNGENTAIPNDLKARLGTVHLRQRAL